MRERKNADLTGSAKGRFVRGGAGAIFLLLLLLLLWTSGESGSERSWKAWQRPVEWETGTEKQRLELQERGKKEGESVRLIAAGDNLIHDVIYQQARQPDGSYDFRPVYERIIPELEAADVAIVNQETPLTASSPPSSYPLFNTPVEMAADLRDSGFDVLNIANNHMLDMGAEGLVETIGNIQAVVGLTVAGASPDGTQSAAIVEAAGAAIAFLGFPEHTNGLVLPEEDREMIVYANQRPLMERMVRAAAEEADIVVVSVHWGEENSREPSPAQRQLARELGNWGADLIIGNHSHVLQPQEYLPRAGGGRVLVLYSLGNLVSAQLEAENLVSALAKVTFTRDDSGEYAVTDGSFIPTVTHYGHGFQELAVWPLESYPPDLARSHGARDGGFSLEAVKTLLEAIGYE